MAISASGRVACFQFAVFALVFGLALTHDLKSAVAGAAERLDSEFPKKIAELEAFYGSLQVSGDLTIVRIPFNAPKVSESYRALSSFLGPNQKWERSPLAKSDPLEREVWCKNADRYIFRLERMKGLSEFSLEDFVPPGAERPKSVYETVHRHVRSPFAINGKPVLQMFRDSSFELVSANYVTLESRDLVHVKYDYNSTDDAMLRGGEWWLDPSQSWCIVKSRSKFFVADKPGVDAGMECSVAYSDSVDGMPVPSSVTIETYLGRYRATESFTSWSVEKSSPGDFTLAHYGLEERLPKTHPQRRLTFSFGSLLLVVGPVGLLAFFFVRRLQQVSRPDA